MRPERRSSGRNGGAAHMPPQLKRVRGSPPVIIGDPSVFAIESGITQAYDRLSQRALGFFVIPVGGRRFGVYKPDATMLGCSFDTVQRRIAERGTHTASFANETDGGRIADAFR